MAKGKRSGQKPRRSGNRSSSVLESPRPKGAWFDKKAADRVCEFFEQYLRHVKGKWAGKRFKLLKWQQIKVLRPLFGWKRKDGTRQYRTAYIEVPKKNGKSELAAGIANFLLFADRELTAEVYSAASDRKQAAIVFNMAKAMRKGSPALRKRSRAYRRSIVVPETASVYEVLSADAFSNDGINASGVIFDELHTQKKRDLWDILNFSTAAREQPLVVAITTAGTDRHSICWENHDYALKIHKGILSDDSFFFLIYAAGEDDPWDKVSTWKKANPSLGDIVKVDYLKDQVKKAKHSLARQMAFRRLHLNQWRKTGKSWMALPMWDASAGTVSIDELKTLKAWGGLDLSTTTDIAAYVMVFQQGKLFKLLCRFWIPEDNMEDREDRDRVPYEEWISEGFMAATPGNVIDYATIKAQILKDNETYNIQEIGYDPWNATQIVTELMDEGIQMVPVRQGFGTMTAPTKELIKLVLAKKFHHGGNPVLRWMADNMVLKEDEAGNLKPDKKKSREKIDGMVAAIMGLDRSLRVPSGSGGSVYENRGVVIL